MKSSEASRVQSTAPSAPVPAPRRWVEPTPANDAIGDDQTAARLAAAENAALAATAEAARLRVEVARLKSEQATQREAVGPNARAATIGACRRVAGPNWTPGTCADCGSVIPQWSDLLDSFVALSTMISAPTPLYRCDGCAATRFARENEARAASELDERRFVRRQELNAAWSSLPPDDRELSVATLRATGRIAVPSKIDEVCAVTLGKSPAKRILLLGGDTGSGKTTMALAILQDVMRAGRDLNAPDDVVRRARTARHFTAADLSVARRQAPFGQEAREVTAALNASLLVIDELGAEAECDQGVIEQIVFARISAGRPTIITTGLTGPVLRKRYTSGFVRRIALDKNITTSFEMSPPKPPIKNGAQS